MPVMSLLDSDRIDRFQFEVFVNNLDFKKQGKNFQKSRTQVNMNCSVARALVQSSQDCARLSEMHRN